MVVRRQTKQENLKIMMDRASDSIFQMTLSRLFVIALYVFGSVCIAVSFGSVHLEAGLIRTVLAVYLTSGGIFFIFGIFFPLGGTLMVNALPQKQQDFYLGSPIFSRFLIADWLED